MKPTTPTKAELYAEREATSKAMLKLISIAERLITKLKATQYSSADQEAREAEAEIAKIRRGKP